MSQRADHTDYQWRRNIERRLSALEKKDRDIMTRQEQLDSEIAGVKAKLSDVITLATAKAADAAAKLKAALADNDTLRAQIVAGGQITDDELNEVLGIETTIDGVKATLTAPAPAPAPAPSDPAPGA